VLHCIRGLEGSPPGDLDVGIHGEQRMHVRRADLGDLPRLIEFTLQEAREAEGASKAPDTLEKGIRVALEDEAIALYWVLVDDSAQLIGSVSVVREWSDWNAGFYWWIQSMYVAPDQRGNGCMRRLLGAVVEELERQQGLELRLYVHQDNKRARSAYEKSGFENSPYDIMVLKHGR
jgi:GNAT superfamily N-acetyltransferase